VAIKSVPAQLNKCLLILVDHNAILVDIDAKLMKRWPHLRRKREIGCGALFITEGDPQLIDDFGFTSALEKRTYESIRHDLRRLAGQELRDSGNAVADDILQQFSWQPTNPVSLVAEKRSGIIGLPELITIITLHMHRPRAQKTVLQETAHASGRWPKLI